jgi:hypothetical protein
MPTLTPEELLRALETSPDEPAVDEDMERILSMTPEEVLSDLLAAGYTADELVAKEDALLRSLLAAPRDPAKAPSPSRPGRDPKEAG